MNNEIVVSIVTRTKDRVITLNRLKENLLTQKYQYFEWIIVNDCGEIISVNQVAEDGKKKGLNITVINNNEPKGRSYPANLGVKNSKGKYVLILDDDDYLNENCLIKMVEFIESHDWLGGVAAFTQEVKEIINENKIDTIKYGEVYKPTVLDFLPWNVFLKNPTPTNGLLVLKEAFLDVGGFPEDIEYTEDWCCWYYITMKYNIGVVPEILAYYSKRVSKDRKYKNTTDDQQGKELHVLYRLKWQKKVILDDESMNFYRVILSNDIRIGFIWKILKILLVLPQKIKSFIS